MKRRLITATITAAFAISAFGGAAFAAQDNVPAPGEPNCFGQRTAYHASGGDTEGDIYGPGQGNPKERADAMGKSVKELNDLVKGNCTATP